MSRTDKTMPYYLQACDPARPGQIDHDHHRIVRYTVRMPVTWGTLMQEQSRWGRDPELVFAAFFGRFRKQMFADMYADGRELKWAQRSLERYLVVKVMPDPALDLTDWTLVGYHDDRRYYYEPAPCDYRPENGLINYHLRQSLGTSGAFNSPQWRRCVWDADAHNAGGVNGYGGHGVTERQLIHRSRRRRVNVLMRRMAQEGPTTELDTTLPRRYARNLDWLLD